VFVGALTTAAGALTVSGALTTGAAVLVADTGALTTGAVTCVKCVSITVEGPTQSKLPGNFEIVKEPRIY
jgi:hypothetical protein